MGDIQDTMAKGTWWILITTYDNWDYMDPDWGSNADENIGHRKEEWAEKVKTGIFEQNQHLRIDRTLYRKITIKGVFEINRESVGIGENRPSYEFYLCVMFFIIMSSLFFFLRKVLDGVWEFPYLWKTSQKFDLFG